MIESPALPSHVWSLSLSTTIVRLIVIRRYISAVSDEAHYCIFDDEHASLLRERCSRRFEKL